MSVLLTDTTACQFKEGAKIIFKTSDSVDIHAKVESIICGDPIFIQAQLTPAQPVPPAFWSKGPGIDLIEEYSSVTGESTFDIKIQAIQLKYSSSTKKFVDIHDHYLNITHVKFERERVKKYPSLTRVPGETCDFCNISGGKNGYKKRKTHIIKHKLVKKNTRKSRKT